MSAMHELSTTNDAPSSFILAKIKQEAKFRVIMDAKRMSNLMMGEQHFCCSIALLLSC
jgi:hypothetical protein